MWGIKIIHFPLFDKCLVGGAGYGTRIAVIGGLTPAAPRVSAQLLRSKDMAVSWGRRKRLGSRSSKVGWHGQLPFIGAQLLGKSKLRQATPDTS